MEVSIVDTLRGSAKAEELARIVRSCVHCGFCNANCPTYQLLGDELDGPRGRIYLVKQALEGGPLSSRTHLHLDRCLGCRACESVCPSGVEYGRLLDLGRELLEEKVPRVAIDRAKRSLLRGVLTRGAWFRWLLGVGRALRPLLPSALKRRIPLKRDAGSWPQPRHARRMLALGGCVQSAIAPRVNAASARVLDRTGISLVELPGARCCGAIDYHLGATTAALEWARRAIDAWWPEIERGADAIVMTASGCGSMVKDYARLLRDDPRYAARASRVAAMTRDISEILAAGDCSSLRNRGKSMRVAVQSPCSLQHGLMLDGVVESLLRGAGFQLADVTEGHLCCGSAGTYSILQPELAARLRDNKLTALSGDNPDCIVTSNIGCLAHLQSCAEVPVYHWIELLD